MRSKIIHRFRMTLTPRRTSLPQSTQFPTSLAGRVGFSSTASKTPERGEFLSSGLRSSLGPVARNQATRFNRVAFANGCVLSGMHYPRPPERAPYFRP